MRWRYVSREQGKYGVVYFLRESGGDARDEIGPQTLLNVSGHLGRDLEADRVSLVKYCTQRVWKSPSLA